MTDMDMKQSLNMIAMIMSFGFIAAIVFGML
jgi:hypothetical protein